MSSEKIAFQSIPKKWWNRKDYVAEEVFILAALFRYPEAHGWSDRYNIPQGDL